MIIAPCVNMGLFLLVQARGGVIYFHIYAIAVFKKYFCAKQSG